MTKCSSTLREAERAGADLAGALRVLLSTALYALALVSPIFLPLRAVREAPRVASRREA